MQPPPPHPSPARGEGETSNGPGIGLNAGGIALGAATAPRYHLAAIRLPGPLPLPGTRRLFMHTISRPWLATLIAGWAAIPVLAQQAPTTLPRPAAAPTTPASPAAAPNAVAATVNGQPILESAVQRGLKRVPPARHAEARPEIINFLIDNALLDQYLQQMRIAVEAKDVDKRIEQMK